MSQEEFRRVTSLSLTQEQGKLTPQRVDDWVRVSNAYGSIVKIQSYFKRQAACAMVQRLAQERRRQIDERRAAQKANPEQAALTEFVTQLEAKHLTPEAFFRICDQAYTRRISTGAFRGCLTNFRLRLSETQIKRLLYIFHEDVGDGSDITYQEYQQALEAYDFCGEKHIVGQKVGGKGYVEHETIVMERLVDMLNSRNMTPSELFTYIDQDNSGQISLKELKNKVFSLQQSLMVKDLQGIEKFFSRLDKDKSGSISRNEFLNHFERAEDMVRTKKNEDMEKQAAGGDDFEEADIAEADQGMLMDAYVTVKGWMGGDKQKFANLEHIIPGYQLMSPRSKCDSAISAVIKEMQKSRLQAKSVFHMADGGNSGKATVKKLRDSFIKVAPKIDTNLISDAMQSFGKKDGDQVTESAFCTTLNYQFDQQVQASVPNSRNNPAAATIGKTKRPATASAIVKPDENACNALIRKLDNQLLRQKMSLFDAFKASDINGDGQVSMDELRQAFKRLLPEDSITPADLKMTMLAFDKNRNNQIDENEFISCITKARENAPPAQQQNQFSPGRRDVSPINFMDNTLSTIGALNNDNKLETDMTKLVLRLIFNNMKMPPNRQNQLVDDDLSIMDAYWCLDDEFALNEINFVSTFTEENKVFESEAEARNLCIALNADFKGTIQPALNLLIEKLRHVNSRVSADMMKRVKAIKMDKQGMVKSAAMKTIFGVVQIQPNDNALQNTFQEMYMEVVGQSCSFRDFSMIFSKECFIKALFVSAETLRSPQDGINGLILATGVWLEDSETLFENQDFRDDWSEIFFRYLARLYDAMDENKSAKALHKSMSSHTKMLKKVSLRKWICFLDNNKLKQVSPQNHKCLYMARQIRTVLPDFVDEMMPLADMQSLIEKELEKYRTQQSNSFVEQKTSVVTALPVAAAVNFQEETKQLKKAKPAPTPVKSDYQSEREDEIVVDIEETIGCEIERPLLPYLEQDQISKLVFMQAITNQSRNITKVQLQSLISAVNDGVNTKQIKIGDFVRFVAGPSDQDKMNKAITTIASGIDSDIREELKSQIIGWEDGVVKDEFMTAFGNYDIDKWTLVCLFHTWDFDDTIDDIVQLETIVKLLSQVKGVTYTQPSAAAPANKASATTANKSKSAAAAGKAVGYDPMMLHERIVEEAKSAVISLAHATFDDIQKFILQKNTFPLAAKKVKPSQVADGKADLCIEDFTIDHEVVMKNVRALSLLQKRIIDMQDLRQSITKMRDWMLTFAGNNEEGLMLFFNKHIVSVMQRPENKHLTGSNVLMLQYGLTQAKNEQGDATFGLFDLLRFKWLFTQRDQLYEMGIDTEYFSHFCSMADMDVDDHEQFAEIIAEAKLRLQIRVHLVTLILLEEKRRKEVNRPFIITNLSHWRSARFIRVTQILGEALKDPKNKKIFIEKFKQFGNKITYYDFQDLANSLGAQCVADWMFEDFLSDLDNMGLALIELNEISAWLKQYGYDIGIATVDIDDSDVLEKRLAIGPQQYQIDPTKDYYRGVPTILNSEVAAITKCLEILGELDQDQVFFDKDFGPQSADDLEGKANSMYCNGIKPQSHADPEQVDWLRPSEYLDSGVLGKFVKGDASANEVKQGALGDCWFIGALSVLATRDELLRGQAECIPLEMVNLIDKESAQMLSSGVYPPIFHNFRHKGIYVMRFSKNHEWRYVIIDDRFPVYKGNMQLVFGKCASPDELWVPLIEKAYAKLHGCYQTLISGFIDDGLADMTSMVCEKRHTHDRRGVFNQNPEEFWNYLNEMKDNGCLMGCSVTGGTEHGIRIDGVDTGVLSGHAYSLNDVWELHDPEMEKERKTHRLMRVRNPWGRGEWKLKWSDQSEEIDQHEEEILKYIDELEADERFELRSNDGTFLINYASWRDIYNRLFVVNDFPDDWSAVRFDTEWTASCSGGLPMEKTLAANQRFAKNPQFLFTSQVDCELFVSLQQNDGREVKADGSYSKYPFKDRIVSTMLFIFELGPNMDRIKEYGKPQPMEKATPKVLHEISMRGKLVANKKYVIIPSPRKAGQTGEFTLGFYTDASMVNFDVKRIDDPTCRYGFVKEEYEKSERSVPNWKIQWCKDHLIHMIGKDDNEVLLKKGKTSLNKSSVVSAGPKKKQRSKVKKQSKIVKAMGTQMKNLIKEQVNLSLTQPEIEEEESDEPLE